MDQDIGSGMFSPAMHKYKQTNIIQSSRSVLCEHSSVESIVSCRAMEKKTAIFPDCVTKHD